MFWLIIAGGFTFRMGNLGVKISNIFARNKQTQKTTNNLQISTQKEYQRLYYINFPEEANKIIFYLQKNNENPQEITSINAKNINKDMRSFSVSFDRKNDILKHAGILIMEKHSITGKNISNKIFALTNYQINFALSFQNSNKINPKETIFQNNKNKKISYKIFFDIEK